jgi:hypothetical protein
VWLNWRVALVQVVEADEEVLWLVTRDSDVLMWNIELAMELIGDLLLLVHNRCMHRAEHHRPTA